LPEASIDNHAGVWSRLQLFFALSRTPHGLLDMCTPAFGALLWLGHFPPGRVIILGLITTFAGYTAVYALNDVIDHRADRKKAAMGGFSGGESYMDGVLVRHPLARGLLGFKPALGWTLGWALVAPLRTVVSGAVTTSGALAAVFAVDPHPSGWYLLVLFLLLFFWEIGAQNIPADWTDIEEDRRLAAQTIPVRLGARRASAIVMGTIVLSMAMNIVIALFVRQYHQRLVFVLISLGIGGCLLLPPAIALYRSRQRTHAMTLFNRASYYPAALLTSVCFQMLI